MMTSIIHMASTPNTESKKTYKLLSNLFAINTNKRYKTLLSFANKVKVYFIYININYR